MFEIDGTMSHDAVVVDAVAEVTTLAHYTAGETIKLAGFICDKLNNE